MELLFEIFYILSHILFVLTLGFYLIQNLQWYNYKIDRVIFNHTKKWWHIVYFLIPLFLYYFSGIYFWIFFYFVYLFVLFRWYSKQDKKLVFTSRVKRFFAFLFFGTIFSDFICFGTQSCEVYGAFFPILVAFLVSNLNEIYLSLLYKKKALKKLDSIKDLKIVAITASYGKTSIKNFLYELLKDDFNTYKTPRSINTLIGIVANINNDLNLDTQIYIVEAGARNVGDIGEIATFLNHQYAIIGEIGKQHIEYFKTEENIRRTKLELLATTKLEKAIIHSGANLEDNEKVIFYGNENIKDLNSDLNSTSWNLIIDGNEYFFETPIIGKFNAYNISAAILLANTLGVDIKKLQRVVKKLTPVEHRLQKIETLTKLVIDDSFNGNLDGMLEAIRVSSTYNGRKVIVTPGIVESDEESNMILAKAINDVFDLVLITGSVNVDILSKHIIPAKRKRVFDKHSMEKILSIETKSGDLILFANDAPTFM